jgi:hypothetical protein
LVTVVNEATAPNATSRADAVVAVTPEEKAVVVPVGEVARSSRVTPVSSSATIW